MGLMFAHVAADTIPTPTLPLKGREKGAPGRA